MGSTYRMHRKQSVIHAKFQVKKNQNESDNLQYLDVGRWKD